MKKKDIKNRIDSSFNIQKDKSFQILKLAFEEIKEQYSISSDEVFNLIRGMEVSNEILVMFSIF